MNNYIKTKNGVYEIKQTQDGRRYFEYFDKTSYVTVFEESDYWKENVVKITKNLYQLADMLVVIQGNSKPKTLNLDYIVFETWYFSMIKNIKEKGSHYYLSMWNTNNDLIKFAELTANGFKYVGE